MPATKPSSIGSTSIDNTYAEAFRTRYTRLVVTAVDDYWVDAACRELCGYGASVIGCDAEVGLEQRLEAGQTPDGRPGAAILAFAFSADALGRAVPNRIGQCVMTCPTTAVYNGLLADGEVSESPLPLGKQLRFFGDGFQKSKQIGQRRFWRVPVMDGEFLVEEHAGVGKGVAGGNIILQAETPESALASARRVVDALAPLPGIITPFPGGVVRSGSKVGSRYRGMVASTNDAFCPTLRGLTTGASRVESQLNANANCAYEVVFNGVDEATVGQATKLALHAGAAEDVLTISAGNYGGKLGKFHFHLRDFV